MAMLSVNNLQVHYGMIQAIKDVSFEVNEGEVIALIGANGAGKTTILHTVSGLLQPTKGSVIFEGQEITKVPAHKIVSLGMAHVPEGRRVFAQLTVLENLKLGAYTRKDKNEMEETLQMIYKRFPRLEERKNQIAGTLSGGEQQMLAMGRALMSHPKIMQEDKVKIIEETFDGRIPKEMVGLMTLMVTKNREEDFLAVFDYFVELVKEEKKIGRADVKTAIPLNDAQKAQIEEKVLATTQYETFEMNYEVDKSLIGGMIVRIGDRVVDSSIKTKLSNLSRDLRSIQV